MPVEFLTKRLLLRPLKLSDAPAIFAYAHLPETSRYTTWSPHQGIQDSLAFIKSALYENQGTPLHPLGITLKATPSLVIGTIGLEFRQGDNEATLSYALSPCFWNQGITTEAAQALISEGFCVYDLKAINAWCLQKNIASSRVMEKIGMVRDTIRVKQPSSSEKMIYYKIINPEL